AVGVIGAGVYLLVGPRLIGPRWFRRATTGVAAGAVGGAVLVHADGIDFTVLQPVWLAISLFVALPAGFGVAIGAAVDAVARDDSWTRVGRRRWVLFALSMACFPPVAIVVTPIAAAVAVFVALDTNEAITRLRSNTAYVLAIRTLWLAVATIGLVALINDVTALV
ncbi:MAG TPA: hypothetical protein VH761_10065, partial [Ilumatobacteraceae bacterium]